MSTAPTARRRWQRTLAILIVSTSVVGLLGACSPRDAPLADVVMVNQARAARGVGPVRWDNELAAKARDWARVMAAQGRLSHSDLRSGISPGWSSLGENVGVARGIGGVHEAFMASAPHRKTILASRFREVGVGVAESRGKVWVVEVYRG